MSQDLVSDEFRDRILVHWAEVGDEPDTVWHKLRNEGFEVELETVTKLLKGGPATIYEDQAILTEPLKKHEESTKLKPIQDRLEKRISSNPFGNRKVKLTHDILEIVSETLDQDEVHSLLSLKKALEKKGIEISKTSVFRALEKLGRSIVEKKKKMNNVPVSQRINEISPSPTQGRNAVRKTVAEMLESCKRHRTSELHVNGQSVASPPLSELVVPSGYLSVNQAKPKKLRTLLPKPSPEAMEKIQQVLAKSNSAAQVHIQGGLVEFKPDQSGPKIVATAVQPHVVTSVSINHTQSIPAHHFSSRSRDYQRRSPDMHDLDIDSEPMNLQIDEAHSNSANSSKSPSPSASVASPTNSASPKPVFTHVKVERTPDEENEGAIDMTMSSLQSIKNGSDRSKADSPMSDAPELERAKSHSPMVQRPKSHSPLLDHFQRDTTSAPPQTQLHGGMSYSPRTSPEIHEENYKYFSMATEGHSAAHTRLIQKHRLSKTIGKIVNMKSQGGVTRAPRKPSVVHRHPSNYSPKEKHYPTSIRSPQKEESSHGIYIPRQDVRTSTAHFLSKFSGGKIPAKHLRTLQMMRAARNGHLGSLTLKSNGHPLRAATSSPVATGTVTSRRKPLGRLNRGQLMSMYAQAMDDDMLPELEIDPPDSGERRNETSSPPPNGTITALKEMFDNMTKEIKLLSQHIQTIQGQLQVIVDHIPSLHTTQGDTVTNNGVHSHLNGSLPDLGESSPQSNDESSEILEDGDDSMVDDKQWGLDDIRPLPKLNTPESNALIEEVMKDTRWDMMAPYAGAPRLAITLARFCIFGTKVLVESSVTGRNSKHPLDYVAMKKIKELLKEKYGHKCNQLEFEMVWKTSRESISQLCKRMRRKFQMTGKISATQEDFLIDS